MPRQNAGEPVGVCGARVILVTIPGEMRGKGCPRFARRGAFVQTFTDEKTANAETWVKACGVKAMAGEAPITGPVWLRMNIAIVPPQSWSKKKRAAALAGEVFPTGKPDLDNCLKLVADALNGIVWQDDKQIVSMAGTKRYAEVAQTTLRVEGGG